MEMGQIVELFERRRAEREPRIVDFFRDGRPGFLIVQRPDFTVYSHCNTIKDICTHNRQYLEQWVQIEHTDELPYLEPWMGTGVYANAYGCPYHWRENDSPHVLYRYHHIEEAAAAPYPDWRASEIMNKVLSCIDALKEMTGGRIPISMTDTQSPYDTATLILDATELFAACYEAPAAVEVFLGKLTDLIIEFSRVQVERIGSELLASPGHIFHGSPALRGLAVSDDNLAVGSPAVNERFALPADERIGREFGGIAIHSCGAWAHTMALLDRYPHIRMVDCAVGLAADPTPNRPAEVREALRGTGIVARVRAGSAEDTLGVLDELAAPDMKLVVAIPWEPERERENYDRIRRRLEAVYARG